MGRRKEPDTIPLPGGAQPTPPVRGYGLTLWHSSRSGLKREESASRPAAAHSSSRGGAERIARRSFEGPAMVVQQACSTITTGQIPGNPGTLQRSPPPPSLLTSLAV